MGASVSVQHVQQTKEELGVTVKKSELAAKISASEKNPLDHEQATAFVADYFDGMGEDEEISVMEVQVKDLVVTEVKMSWVRATDPESIKEHDTVMPLSAFDLANRGRPVPMLWYFQETTAFDSLIDSLKQTLREYPALCGRYNDKGDGIHLNNAGIPVYTCLLDQSLNQALPSEEASCIFQRTKINLYLPPIDLIREPDRVSPEDPLVSIKICHFQEGTGMTVGVRMQHSLGDAQAIVSFIRNWSLHCSGQSMAFLPNGTRCLWEEEEGNVTIPENFPVKALDAPEMPPFMPIWQKINGEHTCMKTVDNTCLEQLASKFKQLLGPKAFVSKNDVLTALVWRALCSTRCLQLDISSNNCNDSTTLLRPCNWRKKYEPRLGDEYFANGVSAVATSLPVEQLLARRPCDIAQILRDDLNEFDTDTVASRARWLTQTRRQKKHVQPVMDSNALSFIISSWDVPWQQVQFGTKPACAFDHAAHLPIVSVFVPIQVGGYRVYASGPLSSMEHFLNHLTQELSRDYV